MCKKVLFTIIISSQENQSVLHEIIKKYELHLDLFFHVLNLSLNYLGIVKCFCEMFCFQFSTFSMLQITESYNIFFHFQGLGNMDYASKPLLDSPISEKDVKEYGKLNAC